jgi:formyl-CoA transferase
MTDVLSAFLLVEHSSGAATPSAEAGAGYRRILTESRRPQRTKDGWMMVFPYLQAHWDLILTVGGAEELVDDPRLSRLSRQADPGFGYAVLDGVIATKTTAEWLELCAAEEIPATEVTSLDEHMQSFPLVEHPVAGPYRQIPSAVRFSRTPATMRRPAPIVGEHSEEVLAEVGLSPEEIGELRAAGVLSHALHE